MLAASISLCMKSTANMSTFGKQTRTIFTARRRLQHQTLNTRGVWCHKRIHDERFCGLLQSTKSCFAHVQHFSVRDRAWTYTKDITEYSDETTDALGVTKYSNKSKPGDITEYLDESKTGDLDVNDQQRLSIARQEYEQYLDDINVIPVQTENEKLRKRRDKVQIDPRQPKQFIRKLGALEKMYNSGEAVCLTTRIQTVYPVTGDLVHKALICLLYRHPLLRSSISQYPNAKSRSNEFYFAQNTQFGIDFCESDRVDWLDYLLEEADRPFTDPECPLFRCRLIRSPPRAGNYIGAHMPTSADSCLEGSFATYETRFLYIVHHSVMDGGYCLWMFQEHVNIIDALVSGNSHRIYPELPVLPAIESLLDLPTKSKHFQTNTILAGNKYVTSKYTLDICYNSTVSDKILLDYNRTYSNEIRMLSSRKPSHGCVPFHSSKSQTSFLLGMCKLENCSPKGAFTSAWMLALLDLIYLEENCDIDIHVPIEYMVDLRRLCGLSVVNECVPSYPGLASMSIPLTAHIKRSNVDRTTRHDFWELARLLDSGISDLIHNDTLLSCLQSQVTVEHENKTKTGKSPFVLCISNMGKCDRAVHDSVNQRVHLSELNGFSTVLVDDMPLFVVTTLSVDGSLLGNVSFCKSYTSFKTANKYVQLMKKYLLTN